MIEKGVVSSIEAMGARIAKTGSDGYVTLPLQIPAHVPFLMPGDIVAYAEFPDHTGVVIAKLEV